MGADKALLRHDGAPMAVRVAGALREAGAMQVLAVGGDGPALAACGLDAIPDDDPGLGPVGGIATALRVADGAIVLACACDLLAPSPAAMAATVAAIEGSPLPDVAVPVADGRRQWVHAAWHPSALAQLDDALAAGVRAVHRVAAGLDVREVAGLDPRAFADADTPADLARRSADGG
jgi:molybdopterin-guanine dinucleotide biosynthesis protein A